MQHSYKIITAILLLTITGMLTIAFYNPTELLNPKTDTNPPPDQVEKLGPVGWGDAGLVDEPEDTTSIDGIPVIDNTSYSTKHASLNTSQEYHRLEEMCVSIAKKSFAVEMMRVKEGIFSFKINPYLGRNFYRAVDRYIYSNSNTSINRPWFDYGDIYEGEGRGIIVNYYDKTVLITMQAGIAVFTYLHYPN